METLSFCVGRPSLARTQCILCCCVRDKKDVFAHRRIRGCTTGSVHDCDAGRGATSKKKKKKKKKKGTTHAVVAFTEGG